MTTRVQVNEKTNKKTGEITRSDRWTNAIVLRSERMADGVYGFAVEVYDGDDTKSFVEKAQAITPETDERAVRGAVAMTAVSGKRIRLQWGTTLESIGVWRDGKKRDWSSEQSNALFHTLEGDLVSLPWQGDGVLEVNAGGQTFRCRVDRDGGVTFGK